MIFIFVVYILYFLMIHLNMVSILRGHHLLYEIGHFFDHSHSTNILVFNENFLTSILNIFENPAPPITTTSGCFRLFIFNTSH